MTRNAQSYFYITDRLGSVTELADGTGNIVQSYVYDSFGNIVFQIGAINNPYTFTGREFDSETGLYYYRARYYDSSIGRFIQEDPLGLLAGDINFYAYVANQPLDFTDPLGLKGGTVGGCPPGFKRVGGGGFCAPTDACGVGCDRTKGECIEDCANFLVPLNTTRSLILGFGLTTGGLLGKLPQCAKFFFWVPQVAAVLGGYGGGVVVGCWLTCQCDPCTF